MKTTSKKMGKNEDNLKKNGGENEGDFKKNEVTSKTISKNQP